MKSVLDNNEIDNDVESGLKEGEEKEEEKLDVESLESLPADRESNEGEMRASKEAKKTKNRLDGKAAKYLSPPASALSSLNVKNNRTKPMDNTSVMSGPTPLPTVTEPSQFYQHSTSNQQVPVKTNSAVVPPTQEKVEFSPKLKQKQSIIKINKSVSQASKVKNNNDNQEDEESSSSPPLAIAAPNDPVYPGALRVVGPEGSLDDLVIEEEVIIPASETSKHPSTTQDQESGVFIATAELVQSHHHHRPLPHNDNGNDDNEDLIRQRVQDEIQRQSVEAEFVETQDAASRRKRIRIILWSVACIIIIGISVGVGLGLGLVDAIPQIVDLINNATDKNNNGDDDDVDRNVDTFQPCTLCYSGNNNNNPTLFALNMPLPPLQVKQNAATCLELQQQLSLKNMLDVTDPRCATIQSLAWMHGCVTSLDEICNRVPPVPQEFLPTTCTVCMDGDSNANSQCQNNAVTTVLTILGANNNDNLPLVSGTQPSSSNCIVARELLSRVGGLDCPCTTQQDRVFSFRRNVANQVYSDLQTTMTTNNDNIFNQDDMPIVSHDVLWDETSKAFETIQWLAVQDPALLSPTGTQVANRFVVALLYFSTEGDRWVRNLDFLSSQPVCMWNNGPQQQGVRCELAGTLDVTSIIIEQSNLVGTIPGELAYLSNLVRLELGRNRLQGTVPAVLTMLSNLERLELLENQLTGTIHGSFFDMGNLVHLNFHDNSLRGTLPSAIGGGRLTDILVGSNAMSGTLPSWIGSNTLLRAFDGSSNGFTGPLVEFTGDSNLQLLTVGNNKLTGTIPSSLTGNTRFRILSLAVNDFVGTIPPFTGNTNMRILELFSNRLVGNLDAIADLPITLESLELQGNFFTGTIPTEIGKFILLSLLQLNNNILTGTLPTRLGNLVALQNGLHVDSNQLRGPIPSEMGRLVNVRIIRLEENNFDSAIPTELGNLRSIQFFDMGRNRLTGTIPTELGKLSTELQALGLNDNILVGTLPSEFSNLVSLKQLFLRENTLTGDADTFFQSLPISTSLELLNIQGNQISGPLTAAGLFRLRSATDLSLNRNRLNSTIPTEIGLLTKVMNILDLDGNQLSGTIPTEFGLLSNLQVLDLARNQLEGTLGNFFGTMTSLNAIDVSVNRLVGTPNALSAAPSLTFAHLADNEFESIGNLCALGARPFAFLAANTCESFELPCSCCTNCCFGAVATNCNDL